MRDDHEQIRLRVGRAQAGRFRYPERVACTRVPLAVLSWAQGAHPLERKKVGTLPNVALLEFAPGFEDPNWCRRAHVLYVLSGVLTFELETGLVQIAEGESCVIDAGTAHRAQNQGEEPVLLFVCAPTRAGKAGRPGGPGRVGRAGQPNVSG